MSRAGPARAGESASPVEARDRAFLRFAEAVRRATGIVLSEDKRGLVEARLGGLAKAAGFRDLEVYLVHLVGPAGPSERQRAFDALTTHTTAFFREAHHFDLLRAVVLPERLAGRPRTEPFRAWSAACSSGEEAYTLALVLEGARRRAELSEYRVLGTDISAPVLEQARRGVYTRDRLRGLGPDALEAGFERVSTPRGKAGRVREEIRERVSFHPFNLVEARWRLRHRFDVVFCRNVLIYFDDATRRAVMQRLVEAVAPGGFLALGHSDNGLTRGLGLEPIGPTIYRRHRETDR